MVYDIENKGTDHNVLSVIKLLSTEKEKDQYKENTIRHTKDIISIEI